MEENLFYILEYQVDNFIVKNLKKFLDKFPECFVYLNEIDNDFLNAVIKIKIAIPKNGHNLKRLSDPKKLDVDAIDSILGREHDDYDEFHIINVDWLKKTTKLTLQYIEEFVRINDSLNDLKIIFDKDFDYYSED